MTRTPKRHWFQFSLRTLLVVVTVLCVWLAFVIVPSQRQRWTVEKIRSLNPPSRALYDYEFSGGPKPRAPEWLRRWIGDDYFQYVARVEIVLDGRDDVTPDELANLPGLEQLSIEGMPLANDRLGSLARLRKLEYLWVDSNDLTDRGLEQLSSGTALEYLTVKSNQITAEGLRPLAALQKLRFLQLESNRISPRGLEAVAH